MRRQKGIDVPDGPADQALLNRRDLVLKALALGAGAAAAAALAPAEALAADGDVVHVGQLATTGTGNTVFMGRNTGGGAGMDIEAAKHDAIRAFAHGTNQSAVYARHDGDGYGVYSAGGRAGVRGVSLGGGRGVEGSSAAGDGIMGEATAANKSGVYAFNDGSGFGVFGRGGVAGVLGLASTALATGVMAENADGGVALSVFGKTALQRSGVVGVGVGDKYATVTVPGGVTAASMYLVTMQGNPGTGVFVAYAKYFSATEFRVYFNKACTKFTTFAWMVLD